MFNYNIKNTVRKCYCFQKSFYILYALCLTFENFKGRIYVVNYCLFRQKSWLFRVTNNIDYRMYSVSRYFKRHIQCINMFLLLLSTISAAILVIKSCLTLWPHELKLTRLFCPWDFLGRNTGVGSHFLLQGIFPTRGSNLRLLHWQMDFYFWATNRALFLLQTTNSLK